MERVAVIAVVGAMFCFATAAVAQDIEVSSLDVKRVNKDVEREVVSETRPGHIIDVKGRQVRLVGQRFFPDNSNDVALFGRADALKREEARSQYASK